MSGLLAGEAGRQPEVAGGEVAEGASNVAEVAEVAAAGVPASRLMAIRRPASSDRPDRPIRLPNLLLARMPSALVARDFQRHRILRRQRIGRSDMDHFL